MSLDNYYFLIASLPALALERPPNLDSTVFFERCRSQLSPRRYRQLENCGPTPNGSAATAAEAQWQAWETYLRNLLILRRVHHSGHEQAQKWLRHDDDVFPGIVRQVEEAITEDNPLERERALDRMRWQQLNHLAVRHEFDFEALQLYRIRLALAEKWREHDREAGRQALAELTDRLLEQAREKAADI